MPKSVADLIVNLIAGVFEVGALGCGTIFYGAILFFVIGVPILILLSL